MDKKIKCPKCGFLNLVGTKKCSKCGTLLDKKSCPKCGTYNNKDAKVCTHCHFNFEKKQRGILFYLILTILFVLVLFVLDYFGRKYFTFKTLFILKTCAVVIFLVCYFLLFSSRQIANTDYNIENEIPDNVKIRQLKKKGKIGIVVGIVLVIGILLYFLFR